MSKIAGRVLGAGMVLALLWSPAARAEESAPRLENRIAKLEARIAALEKKLATSPGATKDATRTARHEWWWPLSPEREGADIDTWLKNTGRRVRKGIDDWEQMQEAREPQTGAFLGVRLTDAPAGGAEIKGVVDDSPAASAGLTPGDVIVRIDGKDVGSAGDVAASVHARAPGDTLTVSIRRAGKAEDVSVTLAGHTPKAIGRAHAARPNAAGHASTNTPTGDATRGHGCPSCNSRPRSRHPIPRTGLVVATARLPARGVSARHGGRQPDRRGVMALIVVVDDQEEWRRLHTFHLTEAGHIVHGFGDGHAMLRGTAQRPDAVVLDLRMYPTGRQVLQALHRKWPALPVIICSAYDGFRDDPDFEHVAAFVPKSADDAALLRAVELAVGSAPRAPAGE